MTVTGIGASSAAASFEPTNSAEVVHTTGGTIAMLVLNAQATERGSDHDQLAAARDEYRQALSDEVGAMHEAADQMFWGAIAQGTIGVIAGAASVYGAASSQSAISDALKSNNDLALTAACTPGAVDAFGTALGSLATPMGKLVSGSDGQDALADAKAASGRGEETRWLIDDLKANLEESKQLTERTTQWLGSAVQQQDAAASAVLSNMA